MNWNQAKFTSRFSSALVCLKHFLLRFSSITVYILISSVTISLSIHIMPTSAWRSKSEARKCVDEFFVSIEDGGHKCIICCRIFNLSKNNFLSNAKIHSQNKHPDVLSEKIVPENQETIGPNFTILSCGVQKRKRLSIHFAKTMLPFNILRSPASRKFLTSLIEWGNIPIIRQLKQTLTKWHQTLSKISKMSIDSVYN